MALAVLRTLTLLGSMLDILDILGNYGTWAMELSSFYAYSQSTSDWS